jgi:hypothetical protein
MREFGRSCCGAVRIVHDVDSGSFHACSSTRPTAEPPRAKAIVVSNRRDLACPSGFKTGVLWVSRGLQAYHEYMYQISTNLTCYIM